MGRILAEAGSRGFVLGLSGVLATGFVGLAAAHAARVNSGVPQEEIFRHVRDNADFSLPLSAEDVAAYAACGFAGSVVLTFFSMLIMAANMRHYRA